MQRCGREKGGSPSPQIHEIPPMQTTGFDVGSDGGFREKKLSEITQSFGVDLWLTYGKMKISDTCYLQSPFLRP